MVQFTHTSKVSRGFMIALAVLTLATVLGMPFALRNLATRGYYFAGAAPRLAVNDPGLSRFQRSLLVDLQRQIDSGIAYSSRRYSMGDPPQNRGACVDVVIRSYLAAGIDLRALVSRDIAAHPKEYRVTTPDPAIDYRRCRNLIVYFRRHALIESQSGDWLPGDIIFWDSARKGYASHVGMIATGTGPSGEPLIVDHGSSVLVCIADGLHSWPIVGHFRWKHA